MGTTSNIVPPIPAGTNTVPGSSTPSPAGSNTNAASTASSNSALSLASNFNTFLNLLTTQLQNQDPTNPVDSNQFTQQLVEFAGVQQQVETNTLLQQLVTAAQGNQVSSAASFVGTSVQATGDQVGLSGGSGTVAYNLASAASSVTVNITDSTGNLVFTGTVNGGTAAGSNTVPWNGVNSFTGAQEPDGTYTVSVTAKDASGNPVTATPYETGVVSSASISNGVIMLDVNGLMIPESSVTSITNLPGTQQTQQTTPTTPTS